MKFNVHKILFKISITKNQVFLFLNNLQLCDFSKFVFHVLAGKSVSSDSHKTRGTKTGEKSDLWLELS